MNYSITWKKDTSSDYKFYHQKYSTVPPGSSNGYSHHYPFADIFIYAYDKKYGIWAYRNHWRKWSSGIGFNATSMWPDGTVLRPFGNFQMMVSVENVAYLEKKFGPTWFDVGVTPGYDHFNNYKTSTKAFEISPRLYAPALPFS